MAFSPWKASGGELLERFLWGDDEDPTKEANAYFNRIPGEMGRYLNPYIDRGGRALDMSEEQYRNLINDPSAMYNKIAGGYHQSPGFQFALNQALQGAGHAAAAGGMAGSPQHEQESMQLGTNIANQDFGNYMRDALGLYNTGLGGMSGIGQMGYGASTNMADSLANALASQGSLAYSGAVNKNMMDMAKRQQLMSLFGKAFGAMAGGGGGAFA